MRIIASLLLGVCALASAGTALARDCTGDADRGCWSKFESGGGFTNMDAVTVTTGVVCSLEVGPFDSQTGTATNTDVLCDKPIGSAGHLAVSQIHSPTKIKSIALANSGIAILGPVTLYALATNSAVYYANGNSHFSSGSDFFPVSFTELAEPLDANGNRLTLTQITADRANDGTAHLLAVSSAHQLYIFNGTRWQLKASASAGGRATATEFS